MGVDCIEQKGMGSGTGMGPPGKSSQAGSPRASTSTHLQTCSGGNSMGRSSMTARSRMWAMGTPTGLRDPRYANKVTKQYVRFDARTELYLLGLQSV